MKKGFTIAFVGRPNVGKSSLFNALLGFRRTIVLDLPGTTMDEVREKVEINGKPVTFIDSQGIFDEGDRAVLDKLLDKADACVLVVDALVGLTPFDKWIATILHQKKVPVLLCANKCDSPNSSSKYEFAGLRFERLIETSASHRRGLDQIKEWAAEVTKDLEAEAQEPLTLRVALIGRPNTGKSTLMNRLVGESVSRVSPLPLTTRDPITAEIKTPQGIIQMIDTAGIRRPRSQKEQVEVFSVNASTRAIQEADVVFLCIACHEPLTDQDMRLLNLIEREGKPTVVILNFWDTISSNAKKEFVNESEFVRYLESFEKLSVSGKTGFNVDKLLPLAFKLWKQSKYRIPTAKLNRIVERMLIKNPPPPQGRKAFNILYASQVRTKPPTFVFFLNRKGALSETYQKYLENQLRTSLHFKSQPIRLLFRAREE